VTNLDHILALSREQTVREADSFTERRHPQFVHYFSPGVSEVLDIARNTGRSGAVMKALRLTGVDCGAGARIRPRPSHLRRQDLWVHQRPAHAGGQF